MGVSSFETHYCIRKCVPNVGLVGLWMGQELSKEGPSTLPFNSQVIALI
jgi:hypothetical protein